MSIHSVNSEQRDAERRLRFAVDEMIGALRVGPGMNDGVFAELREALIEFGRVWKGEKMLPKSAVNILVGLFSWVDSSSYLYSGDEAARIRNAAREIDELIFQYIIPAEAERN
ncbi:MAG: hypothetical protein M3Y33_05140 [Actinomycetota bacterium]|nr:hypothetical protein [Actinomycetota bacterium]